MLFSCKYVCASSASLVCMGTRRGHQIPEMELCTVVICLVLLGTKPGSSQTTENHLNH